MNTNQLFSTLQEWNRYLRRKVRLVACGGTAMTLRGIKPSTRDVDFMVPNIAEHAYLTRQLQSLGYQQVTHAGWQRAGELLRFDLFIGNRIHTTELLNSPLEPGRHQVLQNLSMLQIAVLNDEDLICSKLMRGTRVDFDDCLLLAESHELTLDLNRLRQHFLELISFDIAQERLRPNIDVFLDLLKRRGHHD